MHLIWKDQSSDATLIIFTLIGLKGLSIKIVFLEYKVPMSLIETHTRLIREVKQAQIRINLLIRLWRITFKSIFL